MMRSSWLVLALVGCATEAPPPNGTSVGNPGKVSYRLAPPTEIDVVEASLQSVTTDLVGCDGARESVVAAEDEDLVVGDAEVMPPGTWCGLTLSVDVLTVDGTAGEITASITLEPPWVLTLWMAEPVVVDETEYVLEIGEPGWVTAGQLAPEGDLAGTITPESDVAPLIAQNVAVGTGLYLDGDGDGVVSDAERQAGTLASATWLPPAELGAEDTGDDVDPVSVEGCGNCSTGASPAFGGVASLLALAARRRKAR